MPDPINEILQFATDGTEVNGDVMSLEDYAADEQRLTGNQLGIARRELVNVVLRQATHMAAGIAQFIANRHEAGVVDDADLDKVEAGLVEAVNALIAAGAGVSLDLSGQDLSLLDGGDNPLSTVTLTTPPATYQALAYAATVTPDLTAADAFFLALTGDADLGDMTHPGHPFCVPIVVTGGSTGSELYLSTHVNWAIDLDSEPSDPGTGTRVFWVYSLDDTTKRLWIEVVS